MAQCSKCGQELSKLYFTVVTGKSVQHIPLFIFCRKCGVDNNYTYEWIMQFPQTSPQFKYIDELPFLDRLVYTINYSNGINTIPRLDVDHPPTS